MAWLEPWVSLRLIAGLVAAALLVRASFTAAKVLAYFDLTRATEGQLALERRLELSRTFVRVAAATQIGCLALSALSADKLSHGIRGAMCAYGVFTSNGWGLRALAASGVAAVASGVVLQLFAVDARVRGMQLARTLAIATLALTPLSLLDLALTAKFLTSLDLSAVASCCSTEIDAGVRELGGYATGPRVGATWGAIAAIAATVATAWLAGAAPSRPRAVLVGAMTLLALPLALAASVLEVAPHAFEAPQHACPFCLLHADVLGMGYALYGALFAATVWGLGAALTALVARDVAVWDAARGVLARALRRQAVAWAVAAAVGAAPIVRYLIVARGASLFP